MRTPVVKFDARAPFVCAGIAVDPARQAAPARPGPGAGRCLAATIREIASVCLAVGAIALLSGCRRNTPPPAVAPSMPRIVSLAPSLTEMVCAVGGAHRLVGRTDVCNFPSNLLATVPVVAGFGRPYLEPLLEQKPTVVLDVDLEDQSMGATLARLGIRHQHVECRRLGDIPGAIRMIGRLADCPDAGNTLAGSIEERIRARQAAVASVPPERRPLVFVEIWGDPLMTAGRNSFVSELVALAGGRNLGDELAHDYGTVSTEWVLERNPEIVLCLYPGAGHQAVKIVASRLGWQTIRAVQHGRVYDGFDLDTILRPGPRVLDGVEQLRRVIAEGHQPPAPATNLVTRTLNPEP